MIILTRGNLLEDKVEAIVNTVNCVGVMGKGIALQFKQAFPENFKAYARVCKKGDVRLGKMFIFSTDSFVNPKYIINFPTKNPSPENIIHCKSPSWLRIWRLKMVRCSQSN